MTRLLATRFVLREAPAMSCEFTAWYSLTRRKVSLFRTAVAGLAHTSWMFHTIKPNATKAAMHDANHPVFTGSYRRGIHGLHLWLQVNPHGLHARWRITPQRTTKSVYACLLYTSPSPRDS